MLWVCCAPANPAVTLLMSAALYQGGLVVKEILLTGGLVALVDDEDWPEVRQHNWHAQKSDTTYYALTGANGTARVSLHRMITKASPDQTVDHEDGNGLNNQRGNLRVCTREQNSANRRLNVNNKSGYKGVCWVKRRGKWLAQININKKHYTLGAFTDPWDAAQAYNKAALAAWGEFALLNVREGGVIVTKQNPQPRTEPTGYSDTSIEMTTSEVMWFIGYSSTRATNAWLNRYGIKASGRRPGFNGENVYLRADVEQAKANMPGQGKGGGRSKHRSRQKTIKER